MTRRASAVVVAVAVVAAGALVPLFLSTGRRPGAAQALCLLAAALGLAVAVGQAGLPSLAQGGFMGMAAYTTAVLRVRHHVGPLGASVAAVAVATVGGAVVAWGVRRMRPTVLALSTWLASWAVSVTIGAFPAVTGGAQGLVLSPVRQRVGALGVTVGLGPVAMYEVALGLVVATAGVVVAVRWRYGPAFAALRADPSAAAVAGVPVEALRRGAMVGSAAVAGAAGAVYVQVTGVADPTAYGPLLSAKLLLVVLAGGAETVLGPVVGLVALAVSSRLAHVVAEPLAVALLLVPVFVAGGRGVVRPRARRPVPPAADPQLRFPRGSVEVEHVSVRFGGVVALDDVSVTIGAGTCHAIVGGNGSGKSTLLRALERAAPGRVARTVQRLAVAPELTAVEHVVSGAERARPTGWMRAVLATPMSRRETADVEARARRLLLDLGLGAVADRPAAELNTAEQRLVQVARALISRPGVLLLDEPAAGLGRAERDRLVDLLGTLKQAGLTMVVVEHRMDVVDAVADEVTVLEAGRVTEVTG